jgi:hypothetical protein
MIHRISPFAIAAALALFALPAQAQNFAATPKSAAQVLAPAAKPAAPLSRPGKGANVGQASQPGSSNLSADECRKLGGKTTIDDGGSCRLRMRCTITHGNGDVYSSCIDE